MGMAVILITHDMGVVAETADKVAVMYCGSIVEYGSSQDIFFDAKHPYLQGLKQSVLSIDDTVDELPVIKGNIPDPLHLPQGCRFEPRCPRAMEICKKKRPQPIYFNHEHHTCCWLHGGDHDTPS